MYHIKENGEPGLCRATKKPCPRGNSQEHYSTKEEARDAYEASFNATLGSLSKKAVSKVVDKQGNPLKVYHGTLVDFDEFDNSFTGKGNDSYGSGFYFNTSKEVADSYGNATKVVTLDIKNPIVVNGHDNMSLNHIIIPQEHVTNVLKRHPAIYNQPNDDDMNPLGDYCEEYWDKEEWSQQDIDRMIEKLAKKNMNEVSFTEMESFFGEHATEFRHALKDTVGWDGVQVTFDSLDQSHWIAWDPSQITIEK